MKKLYFLTLFFACLANIHAEYVSEEKARTAARNFLQLYSRLKSGIIDLSPGSPSDYNNVVTYYTFTISGGGWILVSADNAATPVLAYSPSGEWDESTMSPSAKAWLENYSEQIYEAIQARKKDAVSESQWQEILNEQFNDAVKIVSPLLTTQWGQSMYYNDLCPSSSYAPWGYGGHVPAGCVATSMAQIMKYYNYPGQGVGAKTYNLPVYGTLTADFGSTGYNWNSMPLKATSANPALATIMYHCGIAVSMSYNFDGSGAASEVVPYALKTYFNYDNSIRLITKEEVSSDEIWRSVIQAELDAGRPVYYAGSGDAGGHAFVCDGYDSSNPARFHMNWGWNGYSDGYYVLSALSTASGSFNEFNKIIIGIKPRSNPDYICRIETPSDGAEVSAGSDLQVSLKTVKGITRKAVLFLDGVVSDSSVVAPFGFNIKTSGLSAGPHQIFVKTTDGTNRDSHEAGFQIARSCWQKQNITFSVDSVEVGQISPADQNVVWAVLRDYSSGNRFLRRYIKTVNGGTTWTEGEISCPVCGSMDISNIYPLSATRAYACLNPGITTGGAILYTSDGGTSWSVQSSADFTGSWANWVHFFDEKNGVCMGDSYKSSSYSGYNFVVYTTNNGGSTWNRVSTAKLPAALNNEAGTVNFYDAADSILWFGTGNGRIFKSSDRGLSWSVHDSVLNNVQTNVRFKDAFNGIAFGGSGTNDPEFKKTGDGGVTWVDASPAGPVSGQNYEFVPGTGFTWINSGLHSSVSINDNLSYYWLDAGTHISTTAFLSPTLGWAGGPCSLKNGGGIYRWTGNLQPLIDSTVVIRVRASNGNPVPEASVKFNSQYLFSNPEGIAVFHVRSFGNPEKLEVIKEGFAPVSINCFIDDTINILLPPALSVSFQVQNKMEEAVTGATVLFNDQIRVTDANGTVTFNDIGNGIYPFAVTKSRYYAGYGLIRLTDNDTVLNIQLINDITTIRTRQKNQYLVFPNPASGILNIISESTITGIDIISLDGKHVFNSNFNSGRVQVPLSGIRDGEYIIRIFRGNEQDHQKVIIRQ